MLSQSYMEFLEALPGPAWVLDCFLLQPAQGNGAARELAGGCDFVSLFAAGLDSQLTARLRSNERQVNFLARVKSDGTTWAFSATQLEAASRQSAAQRLVLAQPAVQLDVPTEITFDELLDSTFDGLVVLNSARRIVRVNRCFEEMFGYTAGELSGGSPAILVPENRQQEFEESLRKLDCGGIHQMETQRRHRRGHLIDVQVSSQAIRAGRFRGGLVVIYRDTTAANRSARQRNLRVESNRILRETVSLHEAMAELMPAICVALDWDVARFWTSSGGAMRCVESYTRANLAVSGPPGASSDCADNLRSAFEGSTVEIQNFEPGENCASNAACVLRDGSQLAVPIFDAQKHVLGVLEVFTVRRGNYETGRREVLEDICAHLGQFMTRARAERALAENEVRFRTLAETAPVAIFIHDDGRLLYANAAFEALTGYSRDELAGVPLWRMFVEEDSGKLRERARMRTSGRDVEKHWAARILRKNGEVRWIDYSASRLLLGSGPVVLAAATDSTEQRALEMQLRQTQKMEAIGRLAGGVAHDFNNLLTIIGCCSESILAHPGLDPEVNRYTQEISHASDRAAALTRQLLSFSRHQLVAPRHIDFSEVLRSTELILRRALGEDIALSVDFAPGLIILAEPSQIEQVILNLTVNARDAMPDGGRLSVAVRRAGAGEINGKGGNPLGYAVLSVADNGRGMSTEVQQHIFEPFFTTKQNGSGTGLGLSTVYGIVKQCHGFINVCSETGRGTSFDVFFPLADGGSELAADAAPAPMARTGATILLAEDEDDLRAVLVAALQRAGHHVLAVPGGDEAIREGEAHAGAIDLLITDVVMAGMSGRELVDKLAVAYPEMKVLFISGYNEDTVLQKGVVEGQVEFLQKPFTLQKLTQRVDQILNSRKDAV
ncbi:MAG: PAS domain S-box protein [Acidobacteriota bacterium]|nr:PAS domain S-box protein [Acidobacteriota bacterium]